MADIGPNGLAVVFSLSLLYGLALVGLIVLLTMGRQFRAWRTDHIALSRAVALPAAAPVPARTPPDAIQRPKQVVIPSYLPLPVRESQPELVVVQIDPTEGPNRDQRAAQRLVAYLKAEVVRAKHLHTG